MKKIFMLSVLFLTVLSLNFEAKAQAETSTNIESSAIEGVDYVLLPPIQVNDQFSVRRGDTELITIPRVSFIDRISLNIKRNVLCGQGTVQVSFDGMNSRIVSLAGGTRGFRKHILTVGRNIRSIEVKNLSGCKIHVAGIQILPRRWLTGGFNRVTPMSEAGSLVNTLLESSIHLNNLVSDNYRVEYLNGARSVFAKSLAILNANPDTSRSSSLAIQNVINELERIQPLIDMLASVENTFEIANELQNIKYMLQRMIQ